MRNRNFIIGLTVVVTLISIYLFSFTFTARGIERDAVDYATGADGKIDQKKKRDYLDSLIINDVPVRSFLGADFTYKEIKETELALGLDLQGGMHVTLEISPVALLQTLAGNNAKDPIFQESLKQAERDLAKTQKNFTTLFREAYEDKDAEGKLSRIFATAQNYNKGITATSSNDEIIKIIDAQVVSAMSGTLERLRARIDKFGAIQPNIQMVQGTNRILVELPGVENPQRVRALLQGTAQLEFIEVYQIGEIAPYISKIDRYLVNMKKAKMGIDTSAKAQVKSTTEDDLLVDVQGGDSTATAKQDSATVAKNDSTAADSNDVSEFISLLRARDMLMYEIKDTQKINRLLADPGVKSLLPSRLTMVWSKKPQRAAKGEKSKYIELVPCRKAPNEPAALSGDAINYAFAEFNQQDGEYAISMGMKENGRMEWRKMTKAAAAEQRRVAIVLDGYCYSAPVVREEIPNGFSSISGDFTQEEASDLANILEAGKLPVPVRIVEEVTVGPTLGAESIRAGMWSIVAGLALVVLFMVFYYNKSGAVADIALVFNILFTLGAMASLPSGVVLTLPGIAGIVLTIGMAVDANVLIFERIKEELRAGKPLKVSIDTGYDKAFSSIFDSNITTLLVGIILLWLGSGPIKGFATTLIIGIACSFFTAVFISKAILGWFVKETGDLQAQFTTFISRNLFQNLNFDIISKRKTAYIVSASILVIGLGIAAVRGLNLGVDFKGGRSYVVEFKNDVVASDLKSALSSSFDNKGTEVKTYGSNNILKITTSYLIEDESQQGDEKVEAALNSGLTKFSKDGYSVLYSNKVGATVADDIISSSYQSLGLALVGIFIYVLFRFRKWQFSLGGVTALFHDALMIISIFSILHLLGISYEIDQVFVAAVLTIVGFSINDTVIVFDRVREVLNGAKKDINQFKKEELSGLINQAINFTLSRTIMTTFTVLVVVLILLLFGGESLRGFSLAMFIGVVFGSYSTLFIAVPMVLDLWKEAPVVPTEEVETDVKAKNNLKKKPVV
ncbi:MAG: protein translocase subunit SecDF [Cytophagaceae bacterium]|jgi:SecD/SecF fusion protein|nr:protein translocase subunit SecDF [Cytophagaceae bacterium]